MENLVFDKHDKWQLISVLNYQIDNAKRKQKEELAGKDYTSLIPGSPEVK